MNTKWFFQVLSKTLSGMNLFILVKIPLFDNEY
jgi:hypothetical protein